MSRNPALTNYTAIMNITTFSFHELSSRPEFSSADVGILFFIKPSRLLAVLTLLAFLVIDIRAKHIPEYRLTDPVSHNSYRVRTLLPPTSTISGSPTVESHTISLHASDATGNSCPRNPKISRTIWRSDTDWTERDILYESSSVAGYLWQLEARTNISEEPDVDVAAEEQRSLYFEREGS